MKFISWNIDSLNAALTGTSPRSELSRAVLRTIADEDADIIALQEETPESITDMLDPDKPWILYPTAGFRFTELQTLVMKGGVRQNPPEEIGVIRQRLRDQLDHEVWEEEQRFENPHRHYLDMTPAYYELKMELLSKTREEHA